MRIGKWEIRRVEQKPVRTMSMHELSSIVDAFAEPEKITSALQAYQHIGTAYRCITVIRDAGTVPVEVLDSDGNVITSGKAVDWTREPYPGMTWSFWLGLVISQIKISGGSRGLVVSTDPLAIFPYSLNTCTAQVENPPKYPPAKYRIGTTEYPREKIVEFVPPDPVSVWDAISPLEAALLSAKIAYQADLHCSRTLASGATILAALLLKRQFASPEEFRGFLAMFREQLRTAKEHGGVVVLESLDAELKQIGFSIADLKIPELGEISRADIACALGVPPARLGDSAAYFANFREQGITFFEDTLRPLWRLIEDVLNTRIAALLGGGVRFRLKELDTFTARQMWAEFAASIVPVVGRVMTVNEARAKLGLPGIGAEGDKLERPFTAMTYGAESAGGDRVVQAATAVREYMRARRDIRPPEMRRLYWRIFNAQYQGFYERYSQEFRRLFRALVAALEDSGKTHWEKSHTVPYDRTQFDEAAMARRMRLLPAIWREGRSAAAGEVADMSRAMRQNPELTDAVIAIIRRRAEHWTEITGDLTFEAIDGIVAQAVREGWDLRRLVEAFKTEEMLSETRAERIARTEVLAGLNEAKLSMYRESAVALKEWLAVQDDRTREEHSEADGQTVPLDMPFSIGGELLNFPGDPDASPGNTVNCRCTVLPVIVGGEA